MIKKLVVVVFFIGAVMFISAPGYSEDTASSDESMAISADEEMLPAEEGVGEGVVTGEVTALDASSGSISVKGADGAEKAFSVIDGETILWKGIEDIKLSDIKKGDNAEVGYYTNDAGKLVASWVDVIIPEQPAGAGVPDATAPVMTDEE